MNTAAFIVSCAVLLLVLNRLRLVNWRTTRAYAVLQQLFQAAVAFWVMYDACAETVNGYQWALVGFVLVWVLLTKEDWSNGIPEHIQTGSGELGPPELERYKR